MRLDKSDALGDPIQILRRRRPAHWENKAIDSIRFSSNVT